MILPMKQFFSKFILTKRDGWRGEKLKNKLLTKPIIIKLSIALSVVILIIIAYLFLLPEKQVEQIVKQTNNEEFERLKNKKIDTDKVNLFKRKVNKLKKDAFKNYVIEYEKVGVEIPLSLSDRKLIQCDYSGCDFEYEIKKNHIILNDWIKNTEFSLVELTFNKIIMRYNLNESIYLNKVFENIDAFSICKNILIDINFLNVANNGISVDDIAVTRPFKGLKTDLYQKYVKINEIGFTLSANKVSNIYLQWFELNNTHLESYKAENNSIAFKGYIYCLEE